MRNNFIHIFRLVAFVAILASILGSALNSHSFGFKEKLIDKAISKKQSPVDKKSKESKETFIENVSFEAVVPFLHLDLSQELYIIFSQTFLHSLFAEILFQEPDYISKYFKNLFLFVISPNAP